MALKYANNAKTTLNGAITDSATSITVTNGAVFPSLSGGDYFYMTLEDVTLQNEIVKVTAVAGNDLTIVRAQNGTTAKAFADADKAEGRVVTAILDDLGALVNGVAPTSAFMALVDDTTNGALLTTLGINAGVQTWLATPSSANLLAAMSDKTGTGLLVFGTSPTLTTPALGTPSALVLTNATGLPNASVIGLGTAALVNTGTSGATIPLLNGANTWSDTQTLRKSGGDFQFLIDNGANTKQISSWFSSSDDQWNLQPRSAGTLVSNKQLSYNFTAGLWAIGGSPIMTRGAAETVGGAKVWTGVNQFGLQAAQSNTLLSNRGRYNAFEFGHGNTNGYGSTLGAESGSGRPFLAFHGEHGINTSTYRTRGIKASIFRSDNGGGFAWSTVASTSADNQAAVDLMTLSNAGALSWAGTANIGPSGVGLLIQNTAVDYQHTVDKDNTGVVFSTNSGSRGFRWSIGGTRRLDLNTNGSVTVDSASTPMYLNAVSSTPVKIAFYDNGTLRGQIGSNGSYPLYVNNGSGTNIFFIDTTGAVLASEFTLSSDETLKKDFVQYTDALAKVRQLRGGEYTRISTGKREAGLMAQDFERAGLPLYVDNTGNHKTLKYPRTPALLVEAIKELADKVEALEARLAA